MLQAHETLIAIVIGKPQISAVGRVPPVEKPWFSKLTEAVTLNTGLLKIIVGVLTTCHTQYT